MIDDDDDGDDDDNDDKGTTSMMALKKTRTPCHIIIVAFLCLLHSQPMFCELLSVALILYTQGRFWGYFRPL